MTAHRSDIVDMANGISPKHDASVLPPSPGAQYSIHVYSFLLGPIRYSALFGSIRLRIRLLLISELES